MSKRNPAWTLDEWILSLESFLKYGHLSQQEQEFHFQQESEVRQALGNLLGHELKKQPDYRNPTGLWLNQQKFVLIKAGQKDNKRIPRNAWIAWRLFHRHPDSLSKACDIIYASLHPFIGNTHRRNGVILPSEENLSSVHPEGFYLTHAHMAYDKPLLRAVVSNQIRRQKKQDFVQCKSCKDKYKGRDILQLNCHYSGKDEIDLLHEFKYSEYSLYCGDCHAKVHEQKPWINLQEHQLTL